MNQCDGRRSPRQEATTPIFVNTTQPSSEQRLRRSAGKLVSRLHLRRARRWYVSVVANGQCPCCLAARCRHCARELERLVAGFGQRDEHAEVHP
jgi:hypothetical protein